MRDRDKDKARLRTYYLSHNAIVIARSKAWRKNNPEAYRLMCAKSRKLRATKERIRHALYRKTHAAEIKQSAKNYRLNNPDTVATSNINWRTNNLLRFKAYSAQWKKANKGRVAGYTQNRNAIKLRAAPPWVDFSAITNIYIEAARLTKTTGVIHHVHHVYSLQRNKSYTGLHVPWNLKIVTEEEHKALHAHKYTCGFL